jgi:hypothetical protein
MPPPDAKSAQPRPKLSHPARPARAAASDVMPATAGVTGHRAAPLTDRHAGLVPASTPRRTPQAANVRHSGCRQSAGMTKVTLASSPFLHTKVPHMFRAKEAGHGA